MASSEAIKIAAMSSGKVTCDGPHPSAGMFLGAGLVGVHMASTHGISLAMLSSYIPATPIPGLGRVSGTAWSFTDQAVRCGSDQHKGLQLRRQCPRSHAVLNAVLGLLVAAILSPVSHRNCLQDWTVSSRAWLFCPCSLQLSCSPHHTSVAVAGLFT